MVDDLLIQSKRLDTRIPNISSELLPDASSQLQFHEHSITLLLFDSDPRQSAVTLPSSPGANTSCLIVIEIVGFSETGAVSGEHVECSPIPFTSKSPPGLEAGTTAPARKCRFAVLYPGYDGGLDCSRSSSSVSDLRRRHGGSVAALLKGTDFLRSAF